MRTSTRMTIAAGVATMLASAPIGSTLEEQSWVFSAWAGVAFITLAHLVGRWARIPAVFLPFIGALALILYMTVVFTPEEALAGLLPTADSLEALRELFRSGFTDVNELSTPAPETDGLTLLTTAGVGLVAICVDVVAVSMRQPAASGLLLLAMYAVPTAVAFDGVGWVPFTIGASGYLVLLFSEGRERMMRWGRPVPYNDVPGREIQNWPVRISGRRIGVAALAAAVVVPVAIPGFTANSLAFLTQDGSGDGDGLQTQGGNSLSPFVRVRGQLELTRPRDVMRVRTEQDQPFYVRMLTLNQVNGSGDWASRPLKGGQDASDGQLDTPREVDLSGAQRFEAEFQIEDNYADRNLPLYGVPQEFSGLPDGWEYDPGRATVFSERDTTRGLEYQVEYAEIRPTYAQLSSSPIVDQESEIGKEWGGYPTSLPGAVRDQVTELTDGKDTAYTRASAVAGFFTDPDNDFSYNLRPERGESNNPITDFLERREGFCQQYASTLALMFRVAGIPSRVVLGYTSGNREDDGTWVIQTRDAHAWVEAYFENVGWVPYDATPLPDGRGQTLPWAPGGGADPTDPSALPTGPGQTGIPSQAPPIPEEDLNPGAVGPINDDSGAVSPRTVLIGVGLLLAVLLLMTPMTARRVARRRRLRAAGGDDPIRAARRAWDEVMATAEDYGVQTRSAETPRATAVRLAEELHLQPPAAAGLRLIALAEERARYATSAWVDGDLPTAVRAVRRGIRTLARRRRRWRAFLLPPSILRVGSERLALRTNRAMSTVDRAGALLRRPASGLRR